MPWSMRTIDAKAHRYQVGSLGYIPRLPGQASAST